MFSPFFGPVTARFLETTLLLTLSRGLFELTPSPPVFATLRRLIGKCAPALVDASTDDGRSLAALYTLHVALQALHVVVKKAAAGAMSPSQSGFHAGEGSDDDLATASFMKQYVPRVALVGGCRCSSVFTVSTDPTRITGSGVQPRAVVAWSLFCRCRRCSFGCGLHARSSFAFLQ